MNFTASPTDAGTRLPLKHFCSSAGRPAPRATCCPACNKSLYAKYPKGHCKSPTDLKLPFYLGHILLIQLRVSPWLQRANNNGRGGRDTGDFPLQTAPYEQNPGMPGVAGGTSRCLQPHTTGNQDSELVSIPMSDTPEPA